MGPITLEDVIDKLKVLIDVLSDYRKASTVPEQGRNLSIAITEIENAIFRIGHAAGFTKESK